VAVALGLHPLGAAAVVPVALAPVTALDPVTLDPIAALGTIDAGPVAVVAVALAPPVEPVAAVSGHGLDLGPVLAGLGRASRPRRPSRTPLPGRALGLVLANLATNLGP
jgi:hypothetical protein